MEMEIEMKMKKKKKKKRQKHRKQCPSALVVSQNGCEVEEGSNGGNESPGREQRGERWGRSDAERVPQRKFGRQAWIVGFFGWASCWLRAGKKPPLTICWVLVVPACAVEHQRACVVASCLFKLRIVYFQNFVFEFVNLRKEGKARKRKGGRSCVHYWSQ